MTEPNSEALGITENLHSLQGEAKTVGKLMAFVGLTDSPLGCQYCDAVYVFFGGDLLSRDTILQQVKRHQCILVTATGGELLA